MKVDAISLKKRELSSGQPAMSGRNPYLTNTLSVPVELFVVPYTECTFVIGLVRKRPNCTRPIIAFYPQRHTQQSTEYVRRSN